MSEIALPVQTVLDLFASELALVRFGDIDAEVLSKASAAVHAAATEAAAAEAAFADARSRLAERQEALLQQAHRALAYARVYAASDPALSTRLEAITLPRARRATATVVGAVEESSEPQLPRKPRGRPRKGTGFPGGSAEPLLDTVSASAE